VKANLQKHNLSQKHLLKFENESITGVYTKSISDTVENSKNIVEVSPLLVEVSRKYKCKYCEKEYIHQSSLSKHIKYSCTKSNDEDLKELVRLMNLKIESERKDFEKQLQSQAKQIEKLMGKLEIHGSFNNTINNITLLAYRNTDVSHLTTEDYIGFYKKVNHCVKQLIEKIHFNPAKPENMNIYISNMKDKYITVYDGSNWNLANKNEELSRLYEEKEQMLEEWLESNPNPVLKEKFLKYLHNKESDDCLQYIMEEIKLMLYNKGNQLIKKE
jgi:ATP-dependent Clp protease ATP-binding subunit ClpA